MYELLFFPEGSFIPGNVAFLGSFTHIPLESIPGYSGHYNMENVSLDICPTSLSYMYSIRYRNMVSG